MTRQTPRLQPGDLPIKAPLFHDIVHMARALLAVPPQDRIDLADTILNDAIAAQAHYRSLQRPCAREPGMTDNDYIACLQLVLAKIREVNDLAAKHKREVA